MTVIVSGLYKYVPHAKAEEYILMGWLPLPDLHDTHHGHHGVLMVRLCDCPKRNPNAI